MDGVTLTDWLRETYFDDQKRTYFSEKDIEAVGGLLQSMMQYRPSNRPRASQLLNHKWFQTNPFTRHGFENADSEKIPHSIGLEQEPLVAT